MTNRERMQHTCPECSAKPGDPCRDHAGNVNDRPHKTRGPGQLEKHIAEGEARRTARAKASYGPLFQELAEAEVKPTPTAELMARRQFEAAAGLDPQRGPVGMALTSKANRGLEWLRVHDMMNEIGRRAGDRWYHATYARCIEGFGNGIEYVPTTLREMLTTTKPYTFAYFRDSMPDGKVKLRPALVWEPAEPLMTEAEFAARFPKHDHYQGLTDAPEPDDGGLFERTVGALCAAS